MEDDQEAVLGDIYQTPKMLVLGHILNLCFFFKKRGGGSKYDELTNTLRREKEDDNHLDKVG